MDLKKKKGNKKERKKCKNHTIGNFSQIHQQFLKMSNIINL